MDILFEMDRTLRFLAIVTFGGILIAGLTLGVMIIPGRTARETLSTTQSFSLTITPNHTLNEVTILIPLPADANGFSPIVIEAGARNISGLPADWNTTLVGTKEFTFLGISADHINAGEGTATPYTLTITRTALRVPPDTAAPAGREPLFRPRTAEITIPCPTATGGTPQTCSGYATSVFAEYRAVPDTQVEIRINFSGSNTWEVLGTHSGGYRDTATLSLHGTVLPGWHTATGILESGIGEEFP